jgi:hypothetical protein
MRKITIFAVSGALALTANTSTLADSKSAAQFLLTTCLPAMDDVSNVEAMAQEGHWTPKPGSPPTQFRTSNSRWELIKDGLMYEDGEGVPEDHVAAHMWFNLAAHHGPGGLEDAPKHRVEDALKHRKQVAAKITPEQIAEAEKRFAEWRRGGPIP